MRDLKRSCQMDNPFVNILSKTNHRIVINWCRLNRKDGKRKRNDKSILIQYFDILWIAFGRIDLSMSISLLCRTQFAFRFALWVWVNRDNRIKRKKKMEGNRSATLVHCLRVRKWLFVLNPPFACAAPTKTNDGITDDSTKQPAKLLWEGVFCSFVCSFDSLLVHRNDQKCFFFSLSGDKLSLKSDTLDQMWPHRNRKRRKRWKRRKIWNSKRKRCDVIVTRQCRWRILYTFQSSGFSIDARNLDENDRKNRRQHKITCSKWMAHHLVDSDQHTKCHCLWLIRWSLDDLSFCVSAHKWRPSNRISYLVFGTNWYELVLHMKNSRSVSVYFMLVAMRNRFRTKCILEIRLHKFSFSVFSLASLRDQTTIKMKNEKR